MRLYLARSTTESTKITVFTSVYYLLMIDTFARRNVVGVLFLKPDNNSSVGRCFMIKSCVGFFFHNRGSVADTKIALYALNRPSYKYSVNLLFCTVGRFQ